MNEFLISIYICLALVSPREWLGVGSKKNPISFYSCNFDILFDWSISVFIDIYYVVVMLPAPPPSSPLESAQLEQCFFSVSEAY